MPSRGVPADPKRVLGSVGRMAPRRVERRGSVQDEVGTHPLSGRHSGIEQMAPLVPQAPRASLQGPHCEDEARDLELEESDASFGASKGGWPSGLHCG